MLLGKFKSGGDARTYSVDEVDSQGFPVLYDDELPESRWLEALAPNYPQSAIAHPSSILRGPVYSSCRPAQGEGTP